MRFLLYATYYILLVAVIIGWLICGGGIVVGLWWNYWVTGSEENLLFWAETISHFGPMAFIASGALSFVKNFVE